MNKTFNVLDKKITCWMRKHGVRYLRYSLAVTFIWLGLLKPLGWSPVVELVTNTAYWFDPSWFVPFLGWWEVLIGVCLLWKPAIRVGIFLMAVQMMGTLLPLVILPEVTWITFPALTLEGQYIVKNLVLISAALVVGSHVRDGKC